MEPDVPATVKELKRWMKQHCFNFNSYSIHGNTIYEGFGIDTSGGVYAWYYTERGQQRDLEYFSSEQEIVLYAFNKIRSDSWARTHMIGFGDLSIPTRPLGRTCSVDEGFFAIKSSFV
jgi:hypothetical protein